MLDNVRMIDIVSKKIKFIDLFAGIGGFHYAFHDIGGKCVFVSEWDDFARKTYRHNFEKIEPSIFHNTERTFVGDIHNVTDLSDSELNKVIPDFDVLTGGFPCQPFSQAGKKLGFMDTRGTLFHEIKKILQVKKPAAYFIENVRNLESHDGKRTITVIENELRKLGYSFFKKVIKGSDFGLPTHRPRLYMVGFIGDPNNLIEFKWPKTGELPISPTLPELFHGKRCTYDKDGLRVRDIGFTLRVGGRGSRIDDRRNWEFYWVDGKQHRITVEEATLMMGFRPDNFSFPDEVGETQRMKQLGNSVAVNAIKATAKAVMNHLLENKLI